MTLSRALDSVAAALHHPIFDPLELERLRGIVERAGKALDAADELAAAGEHDSGCGIVGRCTCSVRGRIGPARAAYRTATTPPADAGKETT